MDYLVNYLTSAFPLAVEYRSVGMGLQGAMAVRNGPNKDGKMHWFHAFALGTVVAFGGGWFTPLWMGKPTAMIASDLNPAICVAVFLFVNLMPMQFGYKLCKTLPGTMLITSAAQLFRAMGMMGFITTAFNELKPSAYYPIPVLGPILYGTLLGNMGALFTKGFNGVLSGGMGFPFQNGMSKEKSWWSIENPSYV